jgi:hypothetical protein
MNNFRNPQFNAAFAKTVPLVSKHRQEATCLSVSFVNIIFLLSLWHCCILCLNAKEWRAVSALCGPDKTKTAEEGIN